MIIECIGCNQKNRIELKPAQGHPICGKCGAYLNVPSYVKGEHKKTTSEKIKASNNFFIRYWYGDIPLAISYWLVNIVVYLISFFYIISLQYLGSLSQRFNPIMIFCIFIMMYIGLYAITVWQVVGLWRSSGYYIKSQRKRGHWGYIARFMLILALLKTVEISIYSVYPQIKELTNIAFANDGNIEDYRIVITEYAEENREIKIEGGIKYGLFEELKKSLNLNPDITTIELDSEGGRIGEAIDIYHLLSSRRMNTVVNKSCSSACTIIFAAGQNRWAGITGKLGFHSASFAGIPDQEANSGQVSILKEISEKNWVPASFIKKVGEVPSNKIWYPDRRDLLDNGIITQLYSDAASSKRLLDKSLRDIADEINSKLPMRLDETTILDRVTSDKNMLIYIYTVASKSILNQMLISENRKQLGLLLKKKSCSDLNQIIQSGAIIRYMYLNKPADKSAEYFFDISACD